MAAQLVKSRAVKGSGGYCARRETKRGTLLGLSYAAKEGLSMGDCISNGAEGRQPTLGDIAAVSYTHLTLPTILRV